MPTQGIIIGFGKMGQLHYDHYLKIKEVEIIAVIDIDRNQQKKARFLGLKTYAALAECQEAMHADFFDICVPTELHFYFLEIILQQYKKAIFVEKPVVNTLEEAYALERLTAKYPHTLIFVGAIEFYNPHLRGYYEIAENPSYLKCSRTVNLPSLPSDFRPRFLEEKRNKNMTLDCIRHDLCIAISLFGDPILQKVKFEQKNHSCTEVVIRLQFRNFNAEFKVTWLSMNMIDPVITTIELGRRHNNPLIIRLNDDLSKQRLIKSDLCYLELRAFIEAIDTNKCEHSLEYYLTAVKLTNHINEKIKKQNHPVFLPFRHYSPANFPKSVSLTLVSVNTTPAVDKPIYYFRKKNN